MSGDVLLAFGGLLFLFMGLGLAVDPESYARAAADWPSASGGPSGEIRALTARLCLACGLVFLAVAAWLLAALAGLPVGLAERLASFRPTRALTMACGASATAAALSMSAMKMSEWAAPRRSGARSRAAFWSGWGVVFTLLGFGVFLLSRLRVL